MDNGVFIQIWTFTNPNQKVSKQITFIPDGKGGYFFPVTEVDSPINKDIEKNLLKLNSKAVGSSKPSSL